MEINFNPELAAKVAQSAAKQGRDPEQFVQDVVAQYLEEEARFLAAVKVGEEALARGEYLTHEQAGERLRRFL